MANERNGRVISSDGGLYGVYTDDGQRVLCKPRGKFRHEKLRLLVGDRVTLEEDEQRNPCVGKIGERKNALIRPPFANLDMLCIAVAAACPDPILLNVDKLTAICEENHIVVLVVLTKCDLAPEKAQEIAAVYASAGYRVFQTSSLSGEGIEALRSFLTNECEGLVSAFAGASGAGKSTLLNALFPSLSLRTGEVSLRIGRGKNTTRAVVLFPYAELFGGGSGFIADTPGFSLLDFENFDFFGLDDLPYNFPEFVPCLGHCRYTKCTHRREDGCLVIEKVRQGLIAPSRHESYCLLYDQLKNKHEWDKRN